MRDKPPHKTDAEYTDDMSDEEYITDEDDVPYSDEGAFLAPDSI